MASSSSLSTSSALIESRAPRQAAAPPQCVSLPALPPPAAQSRAAKTTSYCTLNPRRPILPQFGNSPSLSFSGRRIPRSVVAMATGDGSVLAGEEIPPAPPLDATEAELPEILKTIQGAWDKIEDKYAVSSLIVAGFIAIWGSSGVISAIDRLPLVPGVLELVGIGYTGWFAYQNLIFKPEREALFRKIKTVYNDVTGATKGDEVIVETSISEVVEQQIEETTEASVVVEQEIEETKASEVVEQESDDEKSREVVETSRFNWG